MCLFVVAASQCAAPGRPGPCTGASQPCCYLGPGTTLFAAVHHAVLRAAARSQGLRHSRRRPRRARARWRPAATPACRRRAAPAAARRRRRRRPAAASGAAGARAGPARGPRSRPRRPRRRRRCRRSSRACPCHTCCAGCPLRPTCSHAPGPRLASAPAYIPLREEPRALPNGTSACCRVCVFRHGGGRPAARRTPISQRCTGATSAPARRWTSRRRASRGSARRRARRARRARGPARPPMARPPRRPPRTRGCAPLARGALWAMCGAGREHNARYPVTSAACIVTAAM